MKTKAKKKPAAKDCGCMNAVQDQLRERGVLLQTRLVINWKTGKSRVAGPVLAVEKIDPKNRKVRLPTIFVTYCPFCGKKVQQ